MGEPLQRYEAFCARLLRLVAAYLEHEAVQGDIDMEATLRKINLFDKQPLHEYTHHIMFSQGESDQEMITTEEISESTRVLHLKSPNQYFKHFCFVCHREWIGWPKKPGKEYTFPAKCNYIDCRSTVWQDKDKGAVERAGWLQKQKSSPAHGAETS